MFYMQCHACVHFTCTYMCLSFRHVRTLKTQSKIDESALANLLEEKQLFLKKALKNYILCLRTGVRTICMPVAIAMEITFQL